MKTPSRLPRERRPAVDLAEILAGTAITSVEDRRRALRAARRPRTGATLRPGKETPLWNALVAEVRPLLRRYGTQASLGRLLGLDRQTIHACFVTRTRMPDAERTLQVLTWLIAFRKNESPS